MRGHELLIEMRLRGLKPELVFLVDAPVDNKWREPTDTPEVSVFTDVPERADLRFLVGLRVSISASTESRAKAFFEAAKAAGAEIVASGWSESPKRNWFRFYDKRTEFDKTIEDEWYAAQFCS
jgi:hypothetical protein